MKDYMKKKKDWKIFKMHIIHTIIYYDILNCDSEKCKNKFKESSEIPFKFVGIKFLVHGFCQIQNLWTEFKIYLIQA